MRALAGFVVGVSVVASVAFGGLAAAQEPPPAEPPKPTGVDLTPDPDNTVIPEPDIPDAPDRTYDDDARSVPVPRPTKKEYPLELVRRGVGSFLDVCTDPAVARIALVEAPSVLGWEEWRAIDARYGLGLVAFGLLGIFVGPVVLAVAYALLSAWLRGDGTRSWVS